MNNSEEAVKLVISLLDEINPCKKTHYKCIKCGCNMYDPARILSNKNVSTRLVCSNDNCKNRSSTLDDDDKRIKVVGQKEILSICSSLVAA